MQAASEPYICTAPISLWRIAEAFLHVLHVLFGSPSDIAKQHTLTHKSYALLTSWLRVGEALLRRLLAIEAAAFPKVDTRPPLKSTSQRVRKRCKFHADKPDAWRVSFHVMDRRRPRRLAPVQAGETPAVHKSRRFHSAWPLAERLEALIRVFNTPAPYARRLAKRLHAAPGRLQQVLRAPPEYQDRVDRADELTEAASAAWPFPDSS